MGWLRFVLQTQTVWGINTNVMGIYTDVLRRQDHTQMGKAKKGRKVYSHLRIFYESDCLAGFPLKKLGKPGENMTS